MSQATVHLPQAGGNGAGPFRTSRRDAWWLQPAAVFAGLTAFLVYATWAALFGYDHYYFHGGGADYLSPFFSPAIWDAPGHTSGHSWFGATPSWWPGFFPTFSPAMLILWAPAGFRMTCYYYRGAYYKSHVANPVACAVGRRRYLLPFRSETAFPLILQNLHRYFLYIAIGFLFILAYDAWRAMWFTAADGTRHFGLGVGTLILIINPILLGGYTLGCHSLRHLVGGVRDVLSGSRARKRVYDCVSCLNRGHMRWAWASLLWVALADVYVRLCSMGVLTDYRLL